MLALLAHGRAIYHFLKIRDGRNCWHRSGRPRFPRKRVVNPKVCDAYQRELLSSSHPSRIRSHARSSVTGPPRLPPLQEGSTPLESVSSSREVGQQAVTALRSRRPVPCDVFWSCTALPLHPAPRWIVKTSTAKPRQQPGPGRGHISCPTGREWTRVQEGKGAQRCRDGARKPCSEGPTGARVPI